MENEDSRHNKFGVDWDAEADRAAAAAFPYTGGSFFEYFKDLVKPHDKMLDLGCNIASWIWAWWDIEPTIEYHGFDWSQHALDIANARYGPGGTHLGSHVPATFHQGDMRKMEFNEEFDIIFTHAVYQHTDEETKKLTVPRVHKALKHGGLHIIQENTSYISNGTWFQQGWIDFFQSFGFKLELVKDFHDGGSGFVFRK
jgi:ubiquinone/menaquinone biosynthesis C-methylase UbiE